MILKKLTEKNKDEIIDLTCKILKSGGLVVFPSDTVYGLLVDATNKKAVEKLINFKNRPAGKPISVFVSGFSMMKKIVFVDEKQEKILKQILPGPYTIVLKSKNKVDPLLVSEKNTLGVRYVNFPYIIDLVKKFKKPITATSANLANQSPHHSIETFLKTLSDKKKNLIDLIVDFGKLKKNKPSTVLDLSVDEIKVLREGDFNFLKSKTFISASEKQTKIIAKNFISKIINSTNQSLVFIIEGELGVGKTVFIKGIGEFFQIKDIISPTFVVYYEYQLKNQPFSKLIHADLYNLKDQEEFKYLHLEKYLEKEKNILCIEWGEKIGEIFELLKNKSKIIYIKISYLDDNKRKIDIRE